MGTKRETLVVERATSQFRLDPNGFSRTSDPLISREVLASLCPKCADNLPTTWKAVKLSALISEKSQMPEGMMDGLCKSLGSDPGLFTACMGKDFGEFDPGDKQAFCAWLHQECTGEMPAEHESTKPSETHIIRKDGDQWCLYTSDGSKKLGCHDSREGALNQEKAIKAREGIHSFEAGRFSGIASVWGSVVDTQPYRTRFRQGAFLKTLNDRSSRVKILSQHDDLATWIGLPTKLQETKDGLYLEASLNNTTLGRDAAEALRHAAALGRLDAVELSIGFDALNCDMMEDEEDQEVFREITEARLWEISLVNFGADRQTRITEAASRAALESTLAPKANRDATFSWILTHLKALREGAAPFKEHAPLSEEQRKQITEELALHIPAGSPLSALTEYERQRKLTEIEIAEAEAAFALLAI